MEIVLIRHAQPDWEPGGRAVDDPALTAHGALQAESAAAHLAKEPFDALYASPLRRVLETASPIGEAIGLSPRILPWLRELTPPSLEGASREEVSAYFERAHAREFHDWWDGLPGGETFHDFYERVTRGIDELLDTDHRIASAGHDEHPLWHVPEGSERILIVAHEVTNAVLVSHLLGLDPVPYAWLRFSSAWTGITRLAPVRAAGSAVWALRSFNAIEHLNGLRREGVGSGSSFGS